VYIFPKKTSLKHRLATDDELFVDFVGKLLEVNPAKRFTAAEVLPPPPPLFSLCFSRCFSLSLSLRFFPSPSPSPSTFPAS